MSSSRSGLALALVLALTFGGKTPSAPATPPACSRVTHVAMLIDGQYADVTCPQGTLRVSLKPGQAAPVRGPASVARATDGWMLVDGDNAYLIVRH
jgi:hypothetical protein